MRNPNSPPMRMSQIFAPTLKEIPADAEIESHRLMLRAGLIRKLASGVYSYLPLAMRVLHKIIRIVREEHERIGCQELLLPALHPAELWRETGRWGVMGETMFRLKDRHERDFCLGMTHEEPVTILVANEVRSYRQLPLSVYQIQTKFRDEPRPRSGVIRAREFIMKDAYTFHASEEDLDRAYREFYRCYLSIFGRCGLTVQVVEADPGAMGGSGSHEFMVLSDSGEDTLFLCGKCGYAANGEKVECTAPSGPPPVESAKLEKVHTPNCRTIDELARFLKRSARDFMKTLLYEADGRLVAVLLRGDREINEAKLLRALGATALDLATPERVNRLGFPHPIGFLGPVGLSGIEVIADHEVGSMRDAVTGANETDYHYMGVMGGRDFAAPRFADLRLAAEGDRCPRCGGELVVKRGIEEGHIFKLGTKYSTALKAHFLDESGTEHPMIMGCYGIGVSRMLACLIEQHHDKDGIIWPAGVAPYQVYLVVVNSDEPAQAETGRKLYDELGGAGWEVILDDRPVRAGVKFKDADLIGIPIRVTVGAKLSQGVVELRMRRTGVVREMPAADVAAVVRREHDAELAICHPQTLAPAGT